MHHDNPADMSIDERLDEIAALLRPDPICRPLGEIRCADWLANCVNWCVECVNRSENCASDSAQQKPEQQGVYVRVHEHCSERNASGFDLLRRRATPDRRP